jgi:hypothetical protein
MPSIAFWKGVEELDHGRRHFPLEPGGEVLLDDAIGPSKEGQHVLDEMLLVGGQGLPMLRSLAKGISSGVQNEATACLYILKRCSSDGLIGNRV